MSYKCFILKDGQPVFDNFLTRAINERVIDEGLVAVNVGRNYSFFNSYDEFTNDSGHVKITQIIKEGEETNVIFETIED